MTLPAIDPVRPLKSRSVPRGREWIYELKLDGFRGVLSVEGGRGAFTSKTGRTMRRFQELAAALARTLPVRSAILDGEIIVMEKRGPNFHALFFRRGDAAYAAFDLLWLNGRDLREQPLWRRKRALQRLVEHTPIGYVGHIDDPALFTLAQQRDFEGIVAKRRTDPYGPAAQWLKIKVAGYSQMEGRWELFDRRSR